MQKVVVQARRSQLEGQTVPAHERVFSIFEPHTELIQRGRRQKPVEFGHAVLLCQTAEKFITDYEVFAERPADCTLTGQVIERHGRLFGERPEVLAADKGFCPDAGTYAALERRVGTLARSAAAAGLCRQGAGPVADLPGGNRGDDLGLKTGLSPGPLLLSGI